MDGYEVVSPYKKCVTKLVGPRKKNLELPENTDLIVTTTGNYRVRVMQYILKQALSYVTLVTIDQKSTPITYVTNWVEVKPQVQCNVQNENIILSCFLVV